MLVALAWTAFVARLARRAIADGGGEQIGVLRGSDRTIGTGDDESVVRPPSWTPSRPWLPAAPYVRHVVFTTGCSASMNWQSLALLESA